MGRIDERTKAFQEGLEMLQNQSQFLGLLHDYLDAYDFRSPEQLNAVAGGKVKHCRVSQSIHVAIIACLQANVLSIPSQKQFILCRVVFRLKTFRICVSSMMVVLMLTVAYSNCRLP